jgi:trimethylamine--corrinoid protein Co-methyltransferase
VENNANILAAVALAQMAHPGAPCIYASSTGILDMRALNFSGNAPESTLIHMASAQMAHFYNLPYYGACTTDSKLPDAQMGYETMQHFLGCAMAGVNIIHVAIGNLAMMSVANYEQCLMDNEILGAAFRLLKGIEVNEDAIGLDAFREVGHKSDFLSSAHTLKYCRSEERWNPRLTDRNTWGQWQQEGGKDMRQRAKEMARKILAEQPAPEFVDAKTQREIWKLANAAQREIEVKRHNNSM